MVIPWRKLKGSNIEWICRLLQAHPDWNHDRLGRQVACALFGLASWKRADHNAFVGPEISQGDNPISGLLKQIRKKRGLTQVELAKIL
jgi:hypothetical protein